MPVKKCDPVNICSHSIQHPDPLSFCQLWSDEKNSPTGWKKKFGQLINIQSDFNCLTVCNKIAFSFYQEMFLSILKLIHSGSMLHAVT